MYRTYKYMPEVNRPCDRAVTDRAYQRHVSALKKISKNKALVDTSRPVTPNRIGRNYKRYENEKQRNEEIMRDNKRIVHQMDKIVREDHFPWATPQKPTQGSPNEEMWTVTNENHKILTAVTERKQDLNRNDWFLHNIDHQYQYTRKAEYKRTVPIRKIVKEELSPNHSRANSRANSRINTPTHSRINSPTHSRINSPTHSRKNSPEHSGATTPTRKAREEYYSKKHCQSASKRYDNNIYDSDSSSVLSPKASQNTTLEDVDMDE